MEREGGNVQCEFAKLQSAYLQNSAKPGISVFAPFAFFVRKMDRTKGTKYTKGLRRCQNVAYSPERG